MGPETRESALQLRLHRKFSNIFCLQIFAFCGMLFKRNCAGPVAAEEAALGLHRTERASRFVHKDASLLSRQHRELKGGGSQLVGPETRESALQLRQ